MQSYELQLQEQNELCLMSQLVVGDWNDKVGNIKEEKVVGLRKQK